MQWERLEPPSVGENGAVLDIEAAGPGFVALASNGTLGSAVLVSEDGREWTAASPPGWETEALVGMTVFDGRLVAVGYDATDVDAMRASVWISDDGLAWEAAPPIPEFESAQLVDVVAAETGLVAIGGYPAADAGAVWTSPDGESWSAAPSIPEFEHAFMWSVTAANDGTLVASGWRRNPNAEVGFDPAFWVSTDGTVWSPADRPTGPGSQVLDVIATADGYVAVGDLVVGGRGFAWVSEDARTWARVEPPMFDGALVDDLTLVPGGVLAVGGWNVDDAGVWVTTDGRNWTAVAHDSFVDADLNAAIVSDEGVILAGATQEQIPGTGSYVTAPMLWYGTLD